MSESENSIFGSILYYIIPIITFLGGIFVRKYFEKPKLNIEVDNETDRTCFHVIIDDNEKLIGNIKYLYIVPQFWATIYNKGPETEISVAEMKIKINGSWTNWTAFVDKYNGVLYNVPGQQAIGLRRSSLGQNEQLIIGKNKRSKKVILRFEFPYLEKIESIKYKLRIIPVKGNICKIKGVLSRYPYKFN